MAAAYDTISKGDQTELEEVYKRFGPIGLKNLILRNKDKWKNMPLGIAVTGQTGEGKSSFINAFLGLSPMDPKAAKTGVNEGTTKIQPYQHPLHTSFVLYDFPGYGTSRFPRESYLKEVSFTDFDFYIIISSVRFTEDDLWLCNEVKAIDKKFFFVRSKIDIDIDSGKHDRNATESMTMAEVKTTLKQNVSEPVYLITTRDRHKYDFPALMAALIEASPKLKKESLILSLPSLTKKVINEKVRVLEERSSKIAIASAIFGALPVPGLSILIDAAVILGEAKFYREQFELDEHSLYKLSRDHSIDIDKLMLESSDIDLTGGGLAVAIPLNLLGNVGKIAVPIIGSIFAGYHYYQAIRCTLCSIIDKMSRDALKINREIAKEIV